MRFAALLILGLFTAQMMLADKLDGKRRELGWAIRMDGSSLDPVELIGARVLSSFRGLFVDALWVRSQSRELRDNLEELPVLYDLITSLQPNFVESSSFAAMNMAMDVSVSFGTAEEQWFWIHEGLRLFDKAIARNANHPRVWRLYRDRAYLISQKCLPSSVFSPHRERFLELYRESYGEDPHQATIRDYRRLLNYDEVPGGWQFTYSRSWENWAANSDDPAQQLECLQQALVAWEETLTKVPQMIDDGNTEHLLLKIEMSRNHQSWVLGDRSSLGPWLEKARRVVEESWRDPLIKRQTLRVLGPKGRNLWVDLLLGKARSAIDRARWNEALEILDHLAVEHAFEALPGWKLSKQDRLAVEAESCDWIQGSIQHTISTNEDSVRAQALKETADSYKKRALTAYRSLLSFDPQDESIKEKIKNLERE